MPNVQISDSNKSMLFTNLTLKQFAAEPKILHAAAADAKAAAVDRLAQSHFQIGSIAAALAHHVNLTEDFDQAMARLASRAQQHSMLVKQPLPAERICALWRFAKQTTFFLRCPEKCTDSPPFDSVGVCEWAIEFQRHPLVVENSLVASTCAKLRDVALNRVRPAVIEALGAKCSASKLLFLFGTLRRLKTDSEPDLASIFFAHHKFDSTNAALDDLRTELLTTVSSFNLLFRFSDLSWLLWSAVASKISAALSNPLCLDAVADNPNALSDFDAALAPIGLAFSPLLVASFEERRVRDILQNTSLSSLEKLRLMCYPRIPVSMLKEVADALASDDPAVIQLWEECVIGPVESEVNTNGGFFHKARLSIVR